jgi:hypothetical protein
MLYFYDVAAPGTALHAFEDNVFSTIFGGRGELGIETKILKSCREDVLKGPPFDVPKLIAVLGNRTNDVANDAVHENNNRAAGAIRIRGKGDWHLQQVANRQPECAPHASARNALCSFKELSGTQDVCQLLSGQRSGSWPYNGDRVVRDAPLQGAVHNPCVQSPRSYGEKNVPLPESKEIWVATLRNSIGQQFLTDWRLEKQVASTHETHALKTRATPLQLRRRNLHAKTKFAEVGQPREVCRVVRGERL